LLYLHEIVYTKYIPVGEKSQVNVELHKLSYALQCDFILVKACAKAPNL